MPPKKPIVKKRILLPALLLFLPLIGINTPHHANAQSSRTASSSPSFPSGSCARQSPLSSVRFLIEDTKYTKNKTAKNLTALHNDGGGVTLGLAGGPIEISIKSRFSIQTQNARACVNLEKLEVLLTAKPEILIASNFKKGTCEYREIINHEQQHIRILRRFVREQTPKLKREVSKILKQTQTTAAISEDNVKRAQTRIQDQVVARITAYQKQVLKTLKKRQSAIDTPREYAKVSRACNNWGKDLANKG